MNRSANLLLLCLLSLLPLSPASAQGDEDNDPARCIRISLIDRTEIIDDRTIAFHMRGGDIYLNQLDRTCIGLDRGDPFSYGTATGQICRNDFITIIERGGFGLQRGASCGLGMFTPTDEESLSMLKGEEEEAEVTIESIEVEE